MQVITPGAWPRDDGDFAVDVNGGKGKPFATIYLDEERRLKLNMQSVDDCDRLMKAAAAAKNLLIEHAGDKDKPHGYYASYGPCLICGQPQDGHPALDGGSGDE